MYVDYALFKITLDYVEMLLRFFKRTLESPNPSGKMMIVRNRAENNLILQIFRQVLEREFLFQIIIQIFEMTYGEHTYLKVLANLVSFPCTKFGEKR